MWYCWNSCGWEDYFWALGLEAWFRSFQVLGLFISMWSLMFLGFSIIIIVGFLLLMLWNILVLVQDIRTCFRFPDIVQLAMIPIELCSRLVWGSWTLARQKLSRVSLYHPYSVTFDGFLYVHRVRYHITSFLASRWYLNGRKIHIIVEGNPL